MRKCDWWGRSAQIVRLGSAECGVLSREFRVRNASSALLSEALSGIVHHRKGSISVDSSREKFLKPLQNKSPVDVKNSSIDKTRLIRSQKEVGI